LKIIGLYVKNDPKAAESADALESWLHRRDMTVVRRESLPPGRRFENHDLPVAPGDLDCIFVLGGDGTFLSAARWVGNQPIPLLGVKFGEVGFLAETAEEDLISAAEKVLSNEFSLHPRMRLEIEIRREQDEALRETVLNDLVINKGALARLASIETHINGHYLTTFRADGLIVSTPTGSTAYSLAAGGPVVHPAVKGIILTPICPFTLTNRPLIVPDAAEIRIRLSEKSSNIMLTFDGQVGVPIDETDTLVIRKGPHPVQMITMPGRHYFDVLKAKLRWSGGRV
jgi:NAD+ kinase